MSNHVTNLCRLLQLTPAQKATLMALADRADDTGICWPGLVWLCEWTCLSRTAVIEAVKSLENSGLLAVERRPGVRNDTRINLDRVEALSQSASRTSPGNKPVREPDGYQSASRTTPVRAPDYTSTGAGPDTSINTIQTSVRHKKTRVDARSASDPDDLADLLSGVDPQVVADFRALRKQKRAALTRTALQGIAREAAKAGMSMEQALTMCCSRGWQGFRAEWTQPPASSALTRTDQRKATIDALTGRSASRNLGAVIDAPARVVRDHYLDGVPDEASQ